MAQPKGRRSREPCGWSSYTVLTVGLPRGEPTSRSDCQAESKASFDGLTGERGRGKKKPRHLSWGEPRITFRRKRGKKNKGGLDDDETWEMDRASRGSTVG